MTLDRIVRPAPPAIEVPVLVAPVHVALRFGRSGSREVGRSRVDTAEA